jgi:hypothetical protein
LLISFSRVHTHEKQLINFGVVECITLFRLCSTASRIVEQLRIEIPCWRVATQMAAAPLRMHSAQAQVLLAILEQSTETWESLLSVHGKERCVSGRGVRHPDVWSSGCRLHFHLYKPILHYYGFIF